MSNIFFVKPDWNYDSYVDYYTLVSLSGYPIIKFQEIDSNSNNVYIVAPANGQLTDHCDNNQWRKRVCKLFLWNLERPSSGMKDYIEGNRKLLDGNIIDGVIVSDTRLAKDAGKGFRYVPIGGHPSLGNPGTFKNKKYDIIHLMCYSNRRGDPWFQEPGKIRDTVDGMSIAPNGWGLDRARSLQSSRVMVNVHQDESFYMEPLRFVLAASYGLPIVTEKCYSIFPYDGLWEAEKSNLTRTVKVLLRNYPSVYRLGWKLRERMTVQFTFRKCLEKYI